jgi:hypothetical protein
VSTDVNGRTLLDHDVSRPISSYHGVSLLAHPPIWAPGSLAWTREEQVQGAAVRATADRGWVGARAKSQCKDFGTGGYSEHKRQKGQCRGCYCQHGRQEAGAGTAAGGAKPDHGRGPRAQAPR